MPSILSSRTATMLPGFACVLVVIFFRDGSALQFEAPPQQFMTVSIGLNLHINCTTDDPQATVKLFRGSKELVVTPNKVSKSGQTFTVINIGLSDAAFYSCKASNVNETIEWPSGYGMLFIVPDFEPPIRVEPGDAQVIQTGESVDLTCYSEGALSTTLTWYKEVNNVYGKVPDNIVTFSTNVAMNEVKSVLSIKDAKQSDAAAYRCTLSHSGKQKSAYGNIIVRDPEPPSIQPYTGNKNVKEPSEKVLPCTAKGLPTPKVTWYKDGKVINITSCGDNAGEKECSNEVYSTKEFSTKLYATSELTIKETKYSRDHGTYTCVAVNKEGTDTLIIELNVQAAPTLIKEKNIFTANYDVATNVSCQVDVNATNPLPEFEWFFQKIPQKCLEVQDCTPKESSWQALPNQNQKVHPASGPTETSVVTLPKDQGPTFYFCRAKNSLGNDSILFKFFRKEKAKPVRIDSEKRHVQYDEEGTLKLSCVDECGPFCYVHWKRNGIELSSNTDQRVNVTTSKTDFETRLVLIITDLHVNDSGNYTCQSSDGTYRDSISVNVKAFQAPVISDVKNMEQRADKENWIELKCSVSGYPAPTVTWYKHGGKLELPGSPINEFNECKNRRSGFYKLSGTNNLVICQPSHVRYTGNYKCEARNRVVVVSKSFYLNVLEVPGISDQDNSWLRSKQILVKSGDKVNKTCKATGNPVPMVEWQKDGTVVSKGQGRAQLLIKSMDDENFGTYICVATNNLASQNKTMELKKESIPAKLDKALLSTGQLIGVIIACIAVVVVVVVICCVICCRQRKQMREYKQFYFLREGGDYKIDPDRSLLEQAGDLPYDADWEFPEHRLVMGEVLGAGAFGQVVKAEAIGILGFNPRDKTGEADKRRSKLRRSMRAKANDDANAWKFAKTTVAVKTLKEGAQESDYKDLASELKILIHLGTHRNIVNLLGACTRGKRLMVIMEFAPHGSLLGFLRSKREIYEPKWVKTTPDPKKEYTLADLVMASYQVSKGLEFLSSKKCVHRDVAARNVLVGQEGDVIVMKIADFGLARDIYKDDLYVKKTSGLLPVKWMAPESLFDREYTEKTDVWSFGILMWEVFTLGGTPYPGLPTEHLLDYISEGKRMDQPKDCPLEVYTMMRDCWAHDPEERPHFPSIAERLGNILEKNVSQDNPYIMLMADEDDKPAGNDYYLQPVEEGNTPAFEGAAAYPGGYLPTTPDGDMAHAPLPSIPPSYDEAVGSEGPNYENDSRAKRTERASSTGAESGIDVEDRDEVMMPLLQQSERDGGTPVTIEMGEGPGSKSACKDKRKSAETVV